MRGLETDGTLSETRGKLRLRFIDSAFLPAFNGAARSLWINLAREWTLAVRSASRTINYRFVSLGTRGQSTVRGVLGYAARFKVQDTAYPARLFGCGSKSFVEASEAWKLSGSRSPKRQFEFLHSRILASRVPSAQVLFGYQWRVS